MSIFESLENLNVSEECFDDIMDLVEEIINEVTVDYVSRAARNSLSRRRKQSNLASKMIDKATNFYDKEKAKDIANNITTPRLKHAEALANGGKDDIRNANSLLKKVEAKYPDSNMNRKLNSKTTDIVSPNHMDHKKVTIR